MDWETLGRHSRIVKEVRTLNTPANRRKSGLFLAEGVRVTEEAVKSGLKIDYFIASEKFLRSEYLKNAEDYVLSDPECRLLCASDELMDSLAQARSDQGIIAAVRMPEFGLDDLLCEDRILVLSEIQDPGNIGTLIRSGLAFGFKAVLICGGADPFNSKAVRSSAGAVFHTKIVYCGSEDIASCGRRLLESGFEFATAEAHGGTDIKAAVFPKRMALILGAEVKGVDMSWQSSARLKVHIPLDPYSESLNVAAAGAVIMYEAASRRI